MTEELAIPAHQPMSFRLFGRVEAHENGRRLDLGTEQEQRLLVALLIAAGNPVTRDRLVDVIWDDVQPESVLTGFYKLVSELRTLLHGPGRVELLPKAIDGTYRLNVAAEQVDLHRFHALTSRAGSLIGRDDLGAAELLEEALRLHRGEPLAGLKGTRIDGYRQTLVEERHAAETTYYELAIRLGKPRTVVPELARLYRDRPGDEWVAWLYMHSLYRSGRQEDAQNVYHDVRKHLDKTIATRSLNALGEFYQRMVNNDPALMNADALDFPTGRPAPIRGARAEDGQDSAPEEEEEAARPGDDATAGETAEPDGRSRPRPVPGPSIVARRIGKATVFNDSVAVNRDFNIN